MSVIIYEALCPKGARMQGQVIETQARLRRVTELLLEAEENYPSQIPQYRDELAKTKRVRDSRRDALMAHVAHCNDGCIRAKGGSLAFATEDPWAKAPSRRDKPDLPGGGELAGMIRDGQTAEALADIYDRSVATIRNTLRQAGFSSITGRPVRLAHRPVEPGERAPEWPPPWMVDGLCAQTDPESFFPEKGGSTREAKATCAKCLVQAECLDYALDNDERFGIWGGMSERDRRKLKKLLQRGDAA